jgi:predicted nucleic acid-binding protein
MSKPGGRAVGTQKIYLETTLFNYYFDKDRDAHADTVKLFMEIAEGKHDAYTSSAVIEELTKAPAEKSTAMLALVGEYGITVLQVPEEANDLADIYVSEGIIPEKYRMDGVHIAVATVNDLDVIVSMNFRHIVKLKTTLMTRAVNILNGYRPIEIISPMEAVENENA